MFYKNKKKIKKDAKTQRFKEKENGDLFAFIKTK